MCAAWYLLDSLVRKFSIKIANASQKRKSCCAKAEFVIRSPIFLYQLETLYSFYKVLYWTLSCHKKLKTREFKHCAQKINYDKLENSIEYVYHINEEFSPVGNLLYHLFYH